MAALLELGNQNRLNTERHGADGLTMSTELYITLLKMIQSTFYLAKDIMKIEYAYNTTGTGLSMVMELGVTVQDRAASSTPAACACCSA